MAKTMSRNVVCVLLIAGPHIAVSQQALDSQLAAGALASPDSQEALDDAQVEQELALLAAIREEENSNGPYSVGLIAHFSSLSLLYEEAGEIDLADVTIERALQVIRANYGLNSLEQAPSIRRLIAHDEARGDAAGAWDLEQDLLAYAGQHPNDLRAVAIYRDTADRRMNVLRRYDSGEFPAEIVIGCYYDDRGVYREAHRRGSTPIAVAPGQSAVQRCRSGSRRHARRRILAEAQAYYSQAADILLRNAPDSSIEIRDLLTEVIESSFRYRTPGVGRSTLQLLIDYEFGNSEAWLPRIEALIRLADWDLVHSSDFGTRMAESAFEMYRRAYDLLIEHEMEELVESVFSPAVPVLLPAFTTNPFEHDEISDSIAHIDVSFVVAEDGKTRQVDVIESTADVPRTAERELVQWIKRSRFRPRVTDGEFAESNPISVRYYPDI